MINTGLNVAMIQSDSLWENPVGNLKVIDSLINSIAIPADIIVLPEMFTTGFSMNASKLAQNMNGEIVKFISLKSVQTGSVICGSVMIAENKKYFNRLIWASPDGTIDFYDKAHLFSYAGEDKVFTAGNERKIFRVKNWRIAPFICFDLRFPCWMRNRGSVYDLIIISANWPSSRREEWMALLRGRAVENQSYLIAVNRTGKDGNGLLYSGDSTAISPDGKILCQLGPEESYHNQIISFSYLEDIRERFPFLKETEKIPDE